MGRSNVAAAFVMMTNRCSMNCKYCFEGKVFRKNKKDMSIETANQASIFLLNAAKRTPDCNTVGYTYFGGEPLLNWDVVRENILYNKKLENENGIHFALSILTNGYKLPGNEEEFFSIVKENDIDMQISLDGCRESHDAARGHFDEIVQNIKKVVESTGKFVSVRMTVTPENADYIYESFKVMSDLSNRIATTLIVEGEWTDEVIERLKTGFKKTINYYNNKYSKRNMVFSVVKALNKGCATICSAGGSFIGISVDGDVYPCHRFITYDDSEKWKMGNIFEGAVERRDLSCCLEKCESCSCSICTPCPSAFLSVKEQGPPEGYCKACMAIEEACRPVAERIFIKNQLDAQNKVLKDLTELNIKMAEYMTNQRS